MFVVDLFQPLFDRLILCSSVPKLEDKVRTILLLLIEISRGLLIITSVRKKLTDMANSLSAKIDLRGVRYEVGEIKYVLNDYASFLIIGSSFERWMWNYLKPQESETFVDVGAHIGKYAFAVAKMVGKGGRVIAVEADPENFELLRGGIRINGLRNVHVLNLAAWNGVEKLRLYRAINSGRGSVKDNKGLGYVEVEAIPLDKVLRGNRVDWIKIDVEGAELETLEGLKQTLEKYHPNVVVEVLKPNVKKVVSFMRKRGYTAKIINMDILWGGVYFFFSRLGSRRLSDHKSKFMDCERGQLEER